MSLLTTDYRVYGLKSLMFWHVILCYQAGGDNVSECTSASHNTICRTHFQLKFMSPFSHISAQSISPSQDHFPCRSEDSFPVLFHTKSWDFDEVKLVQELLQVPNETFSLQNKCKWKLTAGALATTRHSGLTRQQCTLAGRRFLWSVSLPRVSETRFSCCWCIFRVCKHQHMNVILPSLYTCVVKKKKNWLNLSSLSLIC